MVDDDEDTVMAVCDGSDDPVAARAYAFGTLAQQLDGVNNEKIRALGVEMLQRIVYSIKLPKAELRVVPKC